MPARRTRILVLKIASEPDVVLARQRARQIAGALSFDPLDQTRIATAVSEIARNAYQYAGGGTVEYAVEGQNPTLFEVRIQDQGPGITERARRGRGDWSTGGLGIGISGSRALMDRFEIESVPGKTTILLGKYLPHAAPPVTNSLLNKLSGELTAARDGGALQEALQQNHELLQALEDLCARQSEIEQLNAELDDTNRGVMALYSELEEKAEYLRRINDQKSRFFSNMSHEFRTPLNAILSLSRLLLDRIDGELTPEQEKQVTFIRRSAEGLSELVNDLLDMAKAEAGKITIRPSDFSVDSLFGTVRGMLRPIISPGRVELSFEDPAGISNLHTDEGKLSQILRNFISNALKFTVEGSVRVTASMGPADTVVFSVIDTGIGIAPEQQERVFEEFAQVEGPMQHRFRGTGLGLPLSKKLAELLGGTVSLHSEPGKGSTFTVRVPRIYSGPAAVAYVPESGWQIDPTRTPVLIVESDPETLFTYETMLRGTGFQGIPARSIQDARRAIRDVHPAVVVVAHLEGASTAADLVRDFKADARYRATPILAVSPPEFHEMLRLSGVDGFLKGHSDREGFIKQLQRVTQRTRDDVILAIDDDPVARYLMKRLLSDTRYEYVEATGGREGLRIARIEKPQVVLLDLSMPDMSGAEVLTEFHNDDELRDVPVLIVTGLPLSDDERDELSGRSAGILSKQALSREALVNAIREVLEAGAGAHGSGATREAAGV